MAGHLTNRGVKNILDCVFRGASLPSNFYLAAVTDAAAPTAATKTFDELTEIAAGGGYSSGGYSVNLDSTDFDTINEDDSNDYASVELKDMPFAASGADIPPSGDGAYYLVLLDDNGTVADREVWAWWERTSADTVSDGDTTNYQDLELRIANDA